MAASHHPCPENPPTMMVVEPRTTSKPVPLAGKRGGVATRGTPVQVQSINPTTGGMQATGSLKISSSDSYDESSDDDGGASEAAQHLEEVYRRILQALHKTVKMMCTGYVKAVSEIQPIVHAAVQEAIQPNKIYIQSTTGHLSEWGQALHDMLNSSGANAEEREEFSRAARLAGLKCVRSLIGRRASLQCGGGTGHREKTP